MVYTFSPISNEYGSQSQTTIRIAKKAQKVRMW